MGLHRVSAFPLTGEFATRILRVFMEIEGIEGYVFSVG